MPLVRCSGRGGLLIIRNRPLDVKPGWMGQVSDELLARTTFLELVEDWPDDAYVIADDIEIEDL